jgi:cytochrome c oxidase accessory protein FixG
MSGQQPKSKDRPNLDTVSVLDEHGSRKYVYPADAKGRWSRLKPFVYSILIALYVALPFVTINGNPAVWIDLPKRHFYLFGATFNAQDFYMMFFVLTGIGFTLIVAAAVFGRVWCGWACPQTVFLDGVFRRIERWIEGPAEKRRRLAASPMSGEKFMKGLAKHSIYLVLAVVIAHVFLAYFASAKGLGAMITEGPGDHPTTFAWAVGMTAVIYGNFWWFREQLCIVICPYGRLQSVLHDADTVNVIYDRSRGEPRGKLKAKEDGEPVGDCIDCGRCIAVCPTGIDIRNGHQLECIGCSYCIDACDEIMTKVGRPKGLIRYDSERMVTEGKRRFWRPRVFFYGFMGLLGLTVAAIVISSNDIFEAEVLRGGGSTFELSDEAVINNLRVHVVNKHNDATTFTLTLPEAAKPFVTLPQPSVTLQRFEDHHMPVLVKVPFETWHRDMVLPLRVDDSHSGTHRMLELKLIGPHRRMKARQGAETPPAANTPAPGATPEAPR